MKLIVKFLVLLKKYLPRFYFGYTPECVQYPCWIIFPYHPNRLNCGLTSIIEIRKDLQEKPINCKELWETIQNISFDDLFSNHQSLLDVILQKTFFREDESFGYLAKNAEQQNYLWKIAEHLQKWIQLFESSWENDERKNEFMLKIRDIVWRIQQEHHRNLETIEKLAQRPLAELTLAEIRTFRRINSILNIIDRLEIRGRDSAGLVVGLTLSKNGYENLVDNIHSSNLYNDYESRQKLEDLVSLSIKHFENEQQHRLNFTYKICNAVGKLGDNVWALRQYVMKDSIFKLALRYAQQPTTYLSHTRWASNGIINIFNCHPLDNEVIFPQNKNCQGIVSFRAHPYYKRNGHLFVVLNGDIDNYDELKAQIEQQEGIQISRKITTDAKIIAIVIQQGLTKGLSIEQAFRQAVSSFQGSHAIAVQSDLEPDKIFLALHGSGQAIYIGLAEDRYIVASEVYGLVEDTETYLAMDGETPRIPGHPETQGQIFILSQQKMGLEGIQASYYDGTPISLQPKNLKRAEITTRDIDRQNFTHFFDKEIHEAKFSVLNTIKGKFLIHSTSDSAEDKFELRISHIIAEKVANALKSGLIRSIFVVGQGTASIAAQAIAYRMHKTLNNIRVHGLKASELSGFYLQADMSQTLVLAITQSGTTTDTNRAVDMAKKRGAYTMAIVNRRNSQITMMVDSVFYTSNGRDIEMSVASTKAFYSQVTAGEILTVAIGNLIGTISKEETFERLQALKELPSLLTKLLENEKNIAEVAGRWAIKRPHWAIVGSGPNYIAAQEVRIKLSELCYKSIACDYVEDKKHIDLSSEPMILVCSAGTPSSVLGDIIKDVAIFRAHNSLPIVITQEGEHRFDPYATAVIHVPVADELSSLILNTMAGHIFGYHVAQTIHSLSRFFASLRDRIVACLESIPADLILLDPSIQNAIAQFSREFNQRRQEGVFSSSLSPQICSDIAILLGHAIGNLPIQTFHEEFGIDASAKSLLELLLDRLHRAVEELSRPIDAIKHQAKTVTVGTSRLEQTEELQGVIFDALRVAHLSLNELRANITAHIQKIQPAIAEVKGYSYYRLAGLDITGQPTSQSNIQLIRSEGIAQNISSRCSNRAVPLMGTKRSVVQKASIFLGRGGGDQRPILIIPIFSKDNIIEHQILFHVNFAEKLEPKEARAVLSNNDFADIQNAIMEANLVWKDEFLSLVSTEYLCTHSVEEISQEIVTKVKTRL